jgi:hypothetical protein
MGMLSQRLLWVCRFAAAFCLAAGFGLDSRWEIGLVFLAAALLGYLFKKQMGDWFPSVLFVLYLAAASLGLLIGLAPVWMIIGVTAALASWDLAMFCPRLESGSRPDLVINLERRHVEYLGVSMGLGLLMALTGLFLRLQLSFGLMALIVLLVLGSLYQFFQLVSREL